MSRATLASVLGQIDELVKRIDYIEHQCRKHIAWCEEQIEALSTSSQGHRSKIATLENRVRMNTQDVEGLLEDTIDEKILHEMVDVLIQKITLLHEKRG